MKMYLVGGIVRDMLLGLKPKDHDFVCIVEPNPLRHPFALMRDNLEARGVEIFVETPQFLTIKGRFSKEDTEYPGIAADFVLARKDSNTSDGRRPDYVEPGTLVDDLSRRDFTVNAMAIKGCITGKSYELIDPFQGQKDLEHKELWFVGDPMTRIREDALRVMRAFRFCVTKGFVMSSTTVAAIHHPEVPDLLAKISEERRSDELSKMFCYNTVASLDILNTISSDLIDAMFSGRVRLDSTLRK